MSDRKFYRSKNGKIAGVCQGIADYFNWDVTLVRVIVLLLAIVGFSAGLWFYLICWLVAPQEA